MDKNKIIKDCHIGDGTVVWDFVNLYGCSVGKNCTIGAFVEIQKGVSVGSNCKIESHSFICEGVEIEDDVFVGHHVVFTNDKYPKISMEWTLLKTRVKKGASIGSGAIILPGITIGENSLVGAGAVVTRDVAPNTTVVGNPAKVLNKNQE